MLRHIGANGIHSTMDWNGEWDEFFDTLPRRVTLPDGPKLQWYSKVMKRRSKMMQDAGIDQKRLHPYRK